jgi:hypothetical protein
LDIAGLQLLALRVGGFHDAQHRDSALARIGQSDEGALCYTGQGDHKVFNFGWVDFFAARDDHVFVAPHAVRATLPLLATYRQQT